MTPARESLIRVVFENRIDRAVPSTVVLLQQFLGRRHRARDALFQRTQVARLVASVAIEPLPARETASRQAERLLREAEHIATADFRAKAEPRHVLAQFLPLLRAPVLHDLP